MKSQKVERAKRSLSLVCLAGLILICFSSLALGQNSDVPKIDIFTGWQWYGPGGNVPSPLGTYNAPISQSLPDSPDGVGAAAAYNFSKMLALEVDYGKNWTTNGKGMNDGMLSLGPRFMYRLDHADFFGQAMISWNRLSAPGLATDNNIGAVLGGGIDMKITKLFTWRVAEGDYVYARHNYSDIVSSSYPGLRRPSLEGLRFRSGILWTLDYPQTAVPAAACSLQPTEVMQGEPITATASATNFNPKHSLMYDWSGTGGKVTGKDNGASIDTNGVAAGTYMVTAHVKDPKMKKGGEASCTASYTVKPNNPPQMSCSASPSNVQTGGSATVNCTCSSPDNVPVRVSSWNATSGTISGSGSSATLSTTGASAGTSSISAICTDSRGLTAQASTQVTIENPPPPPSPLEAKLEIGRSVYFPTAKPSPQDPNGGLEPSQQKTLTEFATDFKTYLQAKPDAQITLQGHADKRGTAAYNQALSQRRVDRAKNFLVEQGVPASAIQTQALGDEHNLTPEEVKEQVDNTPSLTQEERDRIMKRMQIIIWASNRRVDISLNGSNQTSARHLPFHADDALTIIGGHTSEMKTAKPMPKKKMAPKQ